MLRPSYTTYLLIVVVTLFHCLLQSCKEKKQTEVITPWGSTVELKGKDSDGSMEYDADTASTHSERYTLQEIQKSGEMIMLTISGPNTYYDYHGKGMGVQYMLCEKLAEHLGVTLRVDVCRDTMDMVQRLRNGEGDIIAVPLNGDKLTGFITCCDSWAVSKDNTELAKAVRSWYKPDMLAEAKKQEEYILTVGSVTRHVNPFMLSAEKGTISIYDNLFRKYAPAAGIDWVLIAAQCYQESCFDPNAHSWAGACGLMQIMPSTADHLSLPRSKMYEPEPNISAAARYMRELQQEFADVTNPQERLKFALAAYNGGYHHVRDAMALTKKHGGVWQRWSDVRHYILALAQPAYYNDVVVKYGYMRGSETANYVDAIMQRWQQYRTALRTGTKVVSNVPKKASKPRLAPNAPSTLLDATPHRASKTNKWRKDE